MLNDQEREEVEELQAVIDLQRKRIEARRRLGDLGWVRKNWRFALGLVTTTDPERDCFRLASGETVDPLEVAREPSRWLRKAFDAHDKEVQCPRPHLRLHAESSLT